jgi:primosomal protein N' (replication factor Y)
VVQVAVDAPLRGPLDYLPPPGCAAMAVAPGARVRVPIGRRYAVGVVVGHAHDSAVPCAQLRPILEVLDGEPLLQPALLALLLWTADYYHHPVGEVLAAALPRGLRGGAAASALVQRWRITPVGAAALQAGEPARAPRQRQLLEWLGQAAPPAGAAGPDVAAADIDAHFKDWRATARALAARGWVESDTVETSPRLPPGPSLPDPAAASAVELHAGQRTAIEAIDAAAQAFVLHGATGSGKTEVYLQCAQRVLNRGRSVLVLVPEIGLTPQLVSRFRARLSAPIAVWHSGLTEGERLAAWRAAREGDARVVIGTRSAVFAPLTDLGLIIVDEEHDASYKQHEGGCRYSARDVAVVRAQRCDAPVVLGSATPAFETLRNVELARYRALPLARRADQAPAPRVALVDLRAHAASGGISTPVLQAIERHLAAGQQALVFINRRGYAPTLLCTACGWIAPCRSCDARLTVHRGADLLCCHHCGAEEPLPQRCPRCGFQVKPVGQGTERVEETLRAHFPQTGLARLDRDTARRADTLEQTVRAVMSGAARILVGTQMIAKGHHFPDVTLVAVLNADQGLFATDFRAAERLAQTIVQVAGRAGRERVQGEVLIQTDYPEHPLLHSLLAGGYDTFAAAAMAERRAAAWPPFGRLALLRASSRSASGALDFLTRARACAPETHGVRLLGPVAAAMARRAGRHHAHLLLEAHERAPLHRLLDAWLPRIGELPQARSARWALDIDPLGID